MRLIICLVLVFMPLNASAVSKCECGEPLSFDKQVERAFGVFVGTVKEVDYDPLFGRYRNEFVVHKSWKGAASETISVFTAKPGVHRDVNVGLECTYRFNKGQTYLVISYRKLNLNGPAWTSGCWGNKPLAHAVARNEIERLGRPVKSFSPYPENIVQREDKSQREESGQIRATLLDATPLQGTTPVPESEIQPYTLPTDKKIPTVQMPYIERQ